MDNNQVHTNYQPAPTGQYQAPLTSLPGKQNKVKKVFLFFSIILLIGLVVFFLYLAKASRDALAKTQADLAATQTILKNTQSELERKKAADSFASKFNDAEMSRRMCSGGPMAMFDVHVNEQFAVFRYLCANQSNPIRIAAMKKLDDSGYEFTYGASTVNPNGLPDYIYNSEPNFFQSIYGAKLF